MPPVRLAISGASGRLGQLIAHAALHDQRFELVALGVSEESRLLGERFAGSSLNYSANIEAAFDVLVDVSLPKALDENIALVRRFAAAMVCGVTGYDAGALAQLEVLSHTHAVLHTHNFSRGIAVLRHLAREAARLLGPSFDVGVIDVHHKHKRDAPSGTALSLEAALRSGGATTVQHADLRIGSVVGEHQVHFAGAAEQLTLSHIAADRAMFAAGALDAAVWMKGQGPGRYLMDQIFGVGGV